MTDSAPRPITLAFEHVSVRFGGLLALSDVSFDVPECEIVGLIGPNGAGKTTAFNVACGFQRPTSGSVSFPELHRSGSSSLSTREGRRRAHAPRRGTLQSPQRARKRHGGSAESTGRRRLDVAPRTTRGSSPRARHPRRSDGPTRTPRRRPLRGCPAGRHPLRHRKESVHRPRTHDQARALDAR